MNKRDLNYFYMVVRIIIARGCVLKLFNTCSFNCTLFIQTKNGQFVNDNNNINRLY